MSRARREKKKSNNYFMIIALLICIAVIGVTFWMLNDIKKKVDLQANKPEKNTNIVNNNQIENEIKNENTVEPENTVIENTIENTVENNTAKKTTQINTMVPYKPTSTNKKEEAINLVKKNWGEDDSVDFSFEYINEKGEYVVSVKDKSTATVRCYFKVNITNGSVELD